MLALSTFRSELRPTLHLALPLVLAELGWMSMVIVDTMMVGRLPYSAEAIGAVSISSSLFIVFAFFGEGLMIGLDTLVSQAFGAGQSRRLPPLSHQRHLSQLRRRSLPGPPGLVHSPLFRALRRNPQRRRPRHSLHAHPLRWPPPSASLLCRSSHPPGHEHGSSHRLRPGHRQPRQSPRQLPPHFRQIRIPCTRRHWFRLGHRHLSHLSRCSSSLAIFCGTTRATKPNSSKLPSCPISNASANS